MGAQLAQLGQFGGCGGGETDYTWAKKSNQTCPPGDKPLMCTRLIRCKLVEWTHLVVLGPSHGRLKEESMETKAMQRALQSSGTWLIRRSKGEPLVVHRNSHSWDGVPRKRPAITLAPQTGVDRGWWDGKNPQHPRPYQGATTFGGSHALGGTSGGSHAQGGTFRHTHRLRAGLPILDQGHSKRTS